MATHSFLSLRPRRQHSAGRGGMVFLVLFGAVFALAGLGALTFGFAAARASGDQEGQLASALVGGVFVVIGLAVVWLGLNGGSRARREAEQRARHPDAPWLWKPEWASGRIQGHGRTAMILLAVFALVWNGISWPLVPQMAREIERGNDLAWIAGLFPLCGVLMIVAAARAMVRYRKFGSSVLLMETLPGVIGGHLRAVVQTGAAIEARQCTAMLSCVNVIRTGSGDNRSRHEKIIFQEKHDIEGSQIRPGPRGSEISIAFRIPYDCKPCDDDDPDDEILWRVALTAEVPGVDFEARFDVPVFKTRESSRDIVSAVDEQDLPQVALTPEATPSVPGSKVRVRRLEGDAVELYFGMARNPGLAFGLTAFFGVWSGIVVLLSQLDAPLLFPIVFGGFDLLIGLFVMSLWFGSSRVKASPSALEVRRALLGIGRTRFVPADEVEKVRVTSSMSSGEVVYYDLQAQQRGGRSFTMAGGLRDKRAAEALALTVSKALRLERG